MRQTTCLHVLAGAAATLSAVGSVFAADQERAWTGSADEVRALVSEVMADAETRTSLLAAGATAGYDTDASTFFLASDDGSWRLNIGGYVQFRYLLNFRDDNGGNEDFESGFDTRRTKIIFDGKVATNVFYKIQGNFDSSGVDDGDFELEDAYGGYRWDNGLYLKFGQFKLPFLREELVAESHLLTADLSLTTSIFTIARGQGVEVGYDQEDWRLAVAFSDGGRSINSLPGTNSPYSTNFGVTNGGGESDWAITGRWEYKFAGTWDQYKDFTSFPGSDFLAIFGIAGHVEQSDNNVGGAVGIAHPGPDGAFGTADDALARGETTYGGWTADISFEGDGWNFFFAGNGSHVSDDFVNTVGGAPLNNSNDDYGIVAQGGIFIPNTDFEVFARYDGQFPDSDRTNGVPGANDVFSTVTFGTNWYWSGHAAKFTFDVQWFLDDSNTLTPNFPASTGFESIGWFGDNDENEITLRFQFQFLF